MTAVGFVYGGQTGLYVTKPGFSLDTPGLPRSAFIFNSLWTGTPRIEEEGVSPTGLPTETVPVYNGTQSLSILKSYSPARAIAPMLMTQDYQANGFPPPAGWTSTWAAPPAIRTFWGFTTTTRVYLGSGVRYKIIDQTISHPPGTGGAAGTARVVVDDVDGIKVAADPYDAATETNVDRFLIHPQKKLLMPVGVGQATTSTRLTFTHNGPNQQFVNYSFRYIDIPITWPAADIRNPIADPDPVDGFYPPIYFFILNTTTMRVGSIQRRDSTVDQNVTFRYVVI